MTKSVGEILSPELRRVLYVVFAVVGVGFGATQTAFVTAEISAPLWLAVAFQVYLYVGGAFGLVAATNTSKPTAEVSGIPYEENVDLVTFDVSEPASETPPKHAA